LPSPRVLIVGQAFFTLPWIEDCAAGFSAAGAHVQSFNTHGNGLWNRTRYRLLKKFDHRLAQADALACFENTLDAFQPQLVLFIAPFHQTDFILTARALSQAFIAAWVGDRFSQKDVIAANACHKIYFSDSGFLTLAKEFNFSVATQWLPLATATRPVITHTRKPQGVFVGNATPQRQALLASVTEKLRVLGPGWKTSVLPQHQVIASKIAPKSLASIYAAHTWGLNICNENNVINGLNHRSFEPYTQGTPVIHDDMADLPHCFEPEREILIYRDVEQLNELSRRAKHSPSWLTQIGMQGQRRVLAEHTYLHRAQTILNDLFSS
jgi:spore maturation protein CgeB